jgi:iron complex transport system permease protein
MKKETRILIMLCIIAILVICGAAGVGSARSSLVDTMRVLVNKMFFVPLHGAVDDNTIAIVWKMRFPRVLLAFIIGGSLAIGGTVFQSVLKNQLASPYMMGVSAGASLGAGLIMVSGITLPLIAGFTLPATGFICGLITVWLVVAFSQKIDKTMSNNTVILTGMVFSLFVNALLTTLVALFREELKTLVIWQMGSFAGRGWAYLRLMLPFFIVGTVGVLRYTREMDILTFGEDEAKSAGVESEKVRKRLFLFSAVLSGASVSLSGTIGFVDLIAPHIARKIIGARHSLVIPVSFITGGILMTVSDLLSRVLLAPAELPVGAITAIIGAPFFAWVYFRPHKRAP